MTSSSSSSSHDSNIAQDGELDQRISSRGWQAKNIVKYQEMYEDRLVAREIVTASGKIVSHTLRATTKEEEKKIEWFKDGQVAIAEKCCTPCARINSVRLINAPPFSCFVPANLKIVRLDGSSTCAYCLMMKMGSKCNAQAKGDRPQYVMNNSSQAQDNIEAGRVLNGVDTTQFATKTDLQEINDRLNDKVDEIEKRTGEKIRERSKRITKLEPPPSLPY